MGSSFKTVNMKTVLYFVLLLTAMVLAFEGEEPTKYHSGGIGMEGPYFKIPAVANFGQNPFRRMYGEKFPPARASSPKKSGRRSEGQTKPTGVIGLKGPYFKIPASNFYQNPFGRMMPASMFGNGEMFPPPPSNPRKSGRRSDGQTKPTGVMGIEGPYFKIPASNFYQKPFSRMMSSSRNSYLERERAFIKQAAEEALDYLEERQYSPRIQSVDPVAYMQMAVKAESRDQSALMAEKYLDQFEASC